MCGMSRKYTVSEMSQLQDEERKCAVPGRSNLQHEEKVLNCKERVYSIKMATNFSRRTGFLV